MAPCPHACPPQELSAGLASVSSEDGAVLVTFRSFEELWRFSTYQAAGRAFTSDGGEAAWVEVGQLLCLLQGS